MENIKKLLDILYSSKNGMIYFYIITSLVALIFIVLIILTIKKEKKNIKVIEEKIIDKNNDKDIDVTIPNDKTLNDNLSKEEKENLTKDNKINEVIEKEKINNEEKMELPKTKQDQSNLSISSEEFLKNLNELKNR